MNRIALLFLLTINLLIFCKKSTNVSPEIPSISGNWILERITDEDGNYIAGPEGRDGAFKRMVFNDDGTGVVSFILFSHVIPEPCIWNTNEDQLTIKIEYKDEITHRYEVWFAGEQIFGEVPLGASLLLHDCNQFTTNVSVPLIFYYKMEKAGSGD